MKVVHMLPWAALAGLVAGPCLAVKPVPPAPAAPVRSAPLQPDLEAMITTPTEWASFDWTKAADHRVFKDPRWQPRPDAKADPNGKVVKYERPARMLGVDWKASSWVSSDMPDQPVMSTFSRDVPAAECQAAQAAIGKDLGAAVSNDNSIRIYSGPENYVALLMTTSQWIVGQTSITASCLGTTSTPKAPSESAPDVLLLNVAVQPLKVTGVLAKNFLLRCSRKLKLGLGGDERPVDDMAIWVLPNEPYSIRSPNLRLVSATDEKVLIDDVFIRFAIQTKSGKVAYSIDRVTGGLSAEIKDKERFVGSMNGKCEKATSTTLF